MVESLKRFGKCLLVLIGLDPMLTWAALPQPIIPGGADQNDVISIIAAYAKAGGYLLALLLVVAAFLAVGYILVRHFVEAWRYGNWGGMGLTVIIGVAVIALVSVFAWLGWQALSTVTGTPGV